MCAVGLLITSSDSSSLMVLILGLSVGVLVFKFYSGGIFYGGTFMIVISTCANEKFKLPAYKTILSDAIMNQ